MLRPVESPDNSDDFLSSASEAQRRRARLVSSIDLVADLLSDLRGLAFADALDLVAVHRDDTVTLKRALITKRAERPAALDYLARRIVAILLEPHHGSSVDDVLTAYREVTR